MSSLMIFICRFVRKYALGPEPWSVTTAQYVTTPVQSAPPPAGGNAMPARAGQNRWQTSRLTNTKPFKLPELNPTPQPTISPSKCQTPPPRLPLHPPHAAALPPPRRRGQTHPNPAAAGAGARGGAPRAGAVPLRVALARGGGWQMDQTAAGVCVYYNII